MTRAFRALALTTLGLTLALVVLGATVRVTGSGMGCPDWPLCDGRWLPPWELAPVLEWTHRLVAALVSTCAVLLSGWILAVGSLRQRLGDLAAWLLVFLGCQVALGAYTVAVSNAPVSVALHLLMAYLFLGVLLSIARRELAPRAVTAVSPALRWSALAALLLVLAQAFLGALVSSSHAGRACPDFPTCDGMWLPPLAGAVGLQMLHRYGALALSCWLFGFAYVAELRAPDRLSFWTRLAAFALGAQITIGIAAVRLPVSLAIEVLHQVGAVSLLSLSWLTLHEAIAGIGLASMPRLARLGSSGA